MRARRRDRYTVSWFAGWTIRRQLPDMRERRRGCPVEGRAYSEPVWPAARASQMRTRQRVTQPPMPSLRMLQLPTRSKSDDPNHPASNDASAYGTEISTLSTGFSAVACVMVTV